MNCAPLLPPLPPNHQSCTSHMTSTISPSGSTAARLPRNPHPTRRTSATFSPSMLTHTTSSPVLRLRGDVCTATSCSSPPSLNRHRVTCAAAAVEPPTRTCSRRLTSAAEPIEKPSEPIKKPWRRVSWRAARPEPRSSASAPSATTAR
ncbi:hypothetical protein PR202_gb02385 [Eleusine coracana subsp. coracana]|uniref:Uncharacterized protein n=1 Tax=Eleusine coracana subsp. coracana TaxID=191504 RepID=A0AAV5DYE6_ELECO|nr:hypothetical protein PR202_gb02385 [Eleusine coracana subsp. coracana]